MIRRNKQNTIVKKILFTISSVVVSIFLLGTASPINPAYASDASPTERLWFAAADSRTSVEDITRLIQEGANVNTPVRDKMTPLMQAAMFNRNPEIVRTLIKNGAKANAINTGGATPLSFAAEHNPNLEITRILIENGANVNIAGNSGWTPLMYAAARNKNHEIVRILIEKGAKVNVADGQGRTPLMYAVERNSNPEIVRILIEKGANVNAVSKYGGDTPLKYAARHDRIFKRNPEILLILLDNGANVAAKDLSGKTALDYAEENEELKGTDAYDLLREKTLAAAPAPISTHTERAAAQFWHVNKFLVVLMLLWLTLPLAWLLYFRKRKNNSWLPCAVIELSLLRALLMFMRGDPIWQIISGKIFFLEDIVFFILAGVVFPIADDSPGRYRIPVIIFACLPLELIFHAVWVAGVTITDADLFEVGILPLPKMCVILFITFLVSLLICYARVRRREKSEGSAYAGADDAGWSSAR